MTSWNSDFTVFKDNIREIKNNLVSEIASSLKGEPQYVMSDNALTKNQVIAKVVSTFVGIAASFTLTYMGIKWLTEAMDPTKKEKKLAQDEAQKMLQKLGVNNVGKLTDYELCVAANLLDPSSLGVSWDDIGGLEDTLAEVQESVILPFRHSRLFAQSTLLQPPKGILLHGPPGCGKTMIAKATAKAAGARFINLQVSTLVDKWYGESQKRAEAVFSLAIKLQPTIIFIDEIDSFLRNRSSTDHEATAMMKTQFMSLWDGLTSDPNSRVMVMGATNRPSDVDAAILRRMPAQFYIGMPAADQRESILRLILEDENTEELSYPTLARLAEGLSGSDLREACRTAAVGVAHSWVLDHHRSQASGGDAAEVEPTLPALRMADLQTAIHKVKATKHLGPPPLISVPLD